VKCGAEVAIIYDVDSSVIGGHTAALDACCRDAIASAATRAVRIRVTIPSYTRLLAAAVVIIEYGISRLRWRSGGSNTPRYAAFPDFTPSPALAFERNYTTTKESHQLTGQMTAA
jgi:hypothetical protein